MNFENFAGKQSNKLNEIIFRRKLYLRAFNMPSIFISILKEKKTYLELTF